MLFERYPLWCVAVVAVFCQAALLGAAHSRWGTVDALAFNSVDAREYYALACGLLDNAEFARDGRPEAWRTPGYPAMLAAWALVVGRSPTALIIVQQLLAVVNVVLLAHIVIRASNPRRGWLAAGLLLIEPYHHFYSLWLLSTTVFTTAVLLMWWWWGRAQIQRRWIDVAGLGLFCGAVILLRPLAVLVPLSLAAALLWSSRRELRSAWPRAGCLVVASAILPMLWMSRNASVHGHFALSSQSGVVLAYFKAAEVQLWTEGRSVARYLQTSLDPQQADAPHDVWDSIDQRLREALAPPDTSGNDSVNLKFDVAELHWQQLAAGQVDVMPFRISQQLRRIGSSMLLDAPLSTVMCGLWRAVVLLTTPLNREFVNYFGVPPTGPPHALLGLAYAFIAAFAAWRVVRGGLDPVVCSAALLTLALLATSTPQLDPRLRVPMMPLLIALAVLQRTATTMVVPTCPNDERPESNDERPKTDH